MKSLALGVLAALGAAHITTASTQVGGLLLSDLADSTGYVEMSITEMSCRLGCSVRQARRIIHELRAVGVLHDWRPGQGRTRSPNRYRINVIPIVRGSEADPCR